MGIGHAGKRSGSVNRETQRSVRSSICRTVGAGTVVVAAALLLAPAASAATAAGTTTQIAPASMSAPAAPGCQTDPSIPGEDGYLLVDATSFPMDESQAWAASYDDHMGDLDLWRSHPSERTVQPSCSSDWRVGWSADGWAFKVGYRFTDGHGVVQDVATGLFRGRPGCSVQPQSATPEEFVCDTAVGDHAAKFTVHQVGH